MSFGNLQKISNGKRTFGITPHIPGGFITIETMQKIVDVAKKYNGILKITSGQRILITNLKQEDLENIWNELGMEPAVKTQNSVKNVEICPAGYCKRSKYNTIGTGMKLSRKYQWMEMPCRTKIGVAGCRNACGSVYSKDIGVIADKTGFIVVAGGSGGYNPRMADIIAKDITESQALSLVDNIFEYYIENAEAGEKLGFFIDRIGIEKFNQDVLKGIDM
ncbi:nitrate/sulfite reductase [Clostridium beijerinckii]|jgi:NAD(P)H-nitrite reductase large subunit|uniref:NAD(P)/FAD-dependent oxidoreductase n=2 Tax=Clostridium beijerinckii TaxID=1520 RepID=A0AAE2V2R2_CLOBE|nr:nitrate/sulfite reductase [Clostridium beijerinckii]ABR33943.1 nitrite and sulphite reductase 4Fe-4S region [Clostridium beijerinckii NCIMB 8052]AIU02889.1 nitrite and sulphite reductase 4Fe-4S region [Clostridium beijerinckii ATCC 35702]ALB47031.1 NAD(P)/FAD-dependent oxidoreductase [Clostridium beijerinckii NRRL B-598]MBF7811452.1 NAD(P)/FAD-dependent oxidoreductase [Clostridium beijerinckii]NRT24764.1 NAD(P)H-nitrite reductase large subunit [Clostridium beijerinckii]